MANLTCQNCGAALEIENQFIRTVNCSFCGANYLVSGSEGLQSAGKTASLADYPSRLFVGMSGKLRGRAFHILGRVRYAYPEGFWEEWQIQWEDGAPPDWLEEDEGTWILYKKERVKSAIPPYDQVRVGGTVPVNQYQVFVTEKRKAKIVGQAGQFASVLPLQGEFGYFQGAANDKTVSITFWEDEIELAVGDEIEFHEVKFDQ